MSEPFVGEVRMFAGNFAPRGWALCEGQLLATSQNDALFSLLGTIYGGDGRTTFGLPDMRGRIPIHSGQGPGLSDRRIGSKGGAERVVVNVDQMPLHHHAFKATSSPGDSQGASDKTLAQLTEGNNLYLDRSAPALISMASGSIGATGGCQSHNNLMPTICVHFIIALFGIYPSRN